MTRLEEFLLNDLEYAKLINSNNAFCRKYGIYKASIWLNDDHTKIEDYESLSFRSSVSHLQYQFEMFMEDIEDLKRFEEK